MHHYFNDYVFYEFYFRNPDILDNHYAPKQSKARKEVVELGKSLNLLQDTNIVLLQL